MKNTSFSNTRRIKGHPFEKRVGDNLLIRDKNGAVEIRIGYFTRSQERAREREREIMIEALMKTKMWGILNE